MTTHVIDSLDQEIEYSKGWNITFGHRATWTKNDFAVLSFNGTRVRVFGPIAEASFRKSTYTIDNQVAGTYTNDTTHTHVQDDHALLFASDDLHPGTHTLVVTNLGDILSLGSFEIQDSIPELSTSPAPSPTVSPSTSYVIITIMASSTGFNSRFFPSPSERSLAPLVESHQRSYMSQSPSLSLSELKPTDMPTSVPTTTGTTSVYPVPPTAVISGPAHAKRLGTVVGLVCGVLALLLALSAAVVCLKRRQRSARAIRVEAAQRRYLGLHAPTISGASNVNGWNEYGQRPSLSTSRGASIYSSSASMPIFPHLSGMHSDLGALSTSDDVQRRSQDAGVRSGTRLPQPEGGQSTYGWSGMAERESVVSTLPPSYRTACSGTG